MLGYVTESFLVIKSLKHGICLNKFGGKLVPATTVRLGKPDSVFVRVPESYLVDILVKLNRGVTFRKRWNGFWWMDHHPISFTI